MELEQLKSAGAVASSLEVVSTVGVKMKSIDEVSSLPTSEQSVLQCVVTVSNPVWVATARRRPPQEATAVFSCDSNGMIGCWRRKERTFLLMTVGDDRLMTKKKYDLGKTEVSKMAGINPDAVNATAQMDVFEHMLDGDGAAPAPTAEKPSEKEKSAAKIKAEKIDKVRTSLANYSIGNTDDAVMQNRKYGMLNGFVTKTDNVLKISRKNDLRRDIDGNRIPKPDTPQEVIDKYAKANDGKGKALPATYCEKEVKLAFSDSKPGKIIGVVLATPAGSEIALTKLQTTENFVADDKNLDLVHRIIPIEAAYQYISANYGSSETWIKENPAVVGPTADKVYLKYTYSEKKNEETGEMQSRIRATLALNRKEAKRKTLLTSNNYFPAKVFKTKPLAGASAEDKVAFNYNISATLKKEGAYESLCDESKKQLTLKDDGTFESQWFNNGLKIEVKKFDAVDDSDFVADIKVPIRERAEGEKSHKVTYKYQYAKVGEEGGPETIPVFQKLIKQSGFTEEEFLKKVVELDSRKSGGSRATKASFSAKNYLAAQMSKSIDTGNSKSIMDLASEIEASSAAM